MAVRHTGAVGHVERAGHVRHQPQGFPGWQRSLVQPVIQRRPGDQIADQVRDSPAIVEFRLAGLPHLRYPRRRQLVDGARHQAEPALRRGVPGREGIQGLDRDRLAGRQVGGPPHSSGSSGPDRPDQPESAPDDR